MNFPPTYDIGVILPIAPRGGKEFYNRKLCWQAHDDYFECINEQIEKEGSSDSVNKFLCMNQLYMYEMYCPANFIKMRKYNFSRIVNDKVNWTEDQLELINHKRNNWTFDKPLPNDANFEDPQMNSLLFKHF